MTRLLRRYMLVLICGLFIGLGGAEWLFSGIADIGTVLGVGDMLDLVTDSLVYAQDYNTTDTRAASQNEIETANFLQLLLRGVYLLMRPLLAVAGAALDNTLVYGEMFYLNTSLRRMRQIMRNFANFALGGIFLFALLTRILSGGTMERGGPPTQLLKKILLAVIGIQASRFGMGLMLDLSTIAIYSVGALPLNILSQDLSKDGKTNDLKNIRFLKPLVNFSTDSTKSQDGTDASHSIFYTCNQANSKSHNYRYFIPCRLEGGLFVPFGSEGRNNTWVDWKRKQSDARYSFKKGSGDGQTEDVTREEIYNSISDDFCVWGNGLMKMGAEPEDYENAKAEIERIIRKQMESQKRPEEDILEAIAAAIADIDQYRIFGHPLDQCKVKKLTREATAKGLDGNKLAGGVMGQFECPTLYNLIDRSAGMTGPMYSLYASVMRMSDIALTPNHKGVVEISLEFMIKLLTSVMLILPLFALCIALIIRAVVLRGFIIFLPLLVIARVFFGEKMGSAAGGKASFSSLTGLIFMPVVAVFAISMSLLILTLFNSAEELLGGDYNVLRAFGIETEHPAGRQCLPVKDDATGEITDIRWKNPDGKTDAVDCNKSSSCSAENIKCYSLFFTSICFEDSQRIFGNGLGDIFARLVVNFFGIGLMWMVVFAALGTSKITAGVTNAIQGFGKTLMTSLPIVPTPAGVMSLGGAKQAYDDTKRKAGRALLDPQIQNAQAYTNSLSAQFDKGTTKTLESLKETAAGPKGTFRNSLSGIVAPASTSIVGNSDLIQGFNNELGLKGGKSLNNVGDVFSNRAAYNMLRQQKMTANDARQNWNKKSYAAGAGDNKVMGDAVRVGFAGEAIKGTEVLPMKQFNAKDPATTGERLYLDRTHNELVKIGKEGAHSVTNVDHIPVPVLADIATRKESIAEFNNLAEYREDLLENGGSVIGDTYKKLLDPKNQGANISGSTVNDVSIGGKKYTVIYTDDSFSAIKSFEEIVPPQ